MLRSEDVFLGLLLTHPDDEGEVWRFLAHFGLTARDLLPDDHPVIDAAALDRAAAGAHDTSPDQWDLEVSSLLAEAASYAGGSAQVVHVLAALLMLPAWQDRLQAGLSRHGLSAREVAEQVSTEGLRAIDLRGAERAGAQLGAWLEQRFPRTPATMASFSNDVPDPGADFVGVSEEADAFAYLIASRTLVPPLALGLFGEWGSGKSFLMAKIRHRIGQLTALAAEDSTTNEIWPKVVPIEFNAWQYVETDLWAALLSRIFDELSPEARSRLSELNRRQQQLRAERDENLREQLRIESTLTRLSQVEKTQTAEAAAAAEHTAHVREQISALHEAAVRGAVADHARSAATAGLVGAFARAVDPEVGDGVRHAQELQVAATAAVWRQRAFWSWPRVVWVSVALLVAPAVVVVLDSLGFASSASTTAAVGASAALLVPVLRMAASFVQGQQQAADAATRKVHDQLAELIATAQDAQKHKEQAVAATRGEIEVEQTKAAQVGAHRVDLDEMATRLDARTAYGDFLSGRHTAEDYRKRLGVVSTVSEDLRALSGLVAEYNLSPEGLGPEGPPNRIVLYIDDLDRCPPARVVEVLEAVHLLLAFPLFVVVVAVDTRWLTNALHQALPLLTEEQGTEVAAPTATDYLEKIFQIPFWVERLDTSARKRLLRGLLLPSVRAPDSAGAPPTGTVVSVGDAQRHAADRMLAVHGAGLDRDARQFTITSDELSFVEALNPLMSGTPRQVKRFVNVCKLLLAMSPPLTEGSGIATERTAACFMAALHQSMPGFAVQLAAALDLAPDDATLTTVLSDLSSPTPSGECRRVQDWLVELVPTPRESSFGLADASMLLKRWDVIRRLRFAEEESRAVAVPAGHVGAAGS